MKHAIHRVTWFEIISPYTLRVGFEDGTEQTINFKPILAGELYGPLRDSDLFNQVSIDSDAHTLVWPNGRTLIQPLYMTGTNTSTILLNLCVAGSRYKRKPPDTAW
jgi:hypothetical protein